MSLTEEQKRKIDARIKKDRLNQYGDPADTVYAGGNPLFDMNSGKMLDRFEYILRRHPDWLSK